MCNVIQWNESFYSASQISQTQFESREQLKSAFAAYEENQLQKLKEDNVLGKPFQNIRQLNTRTINPDVFSNDSYTFL